MRIFRDDIEFEFSIGGNIVKATATLSITTKPAAAPPLQITTTTLPDAQVGVPYSGNVAISGGVAPDKFSITAGALPDGLSIDPASGNITGTPTPAAVGTDGFTVEVDDSTI